jgi:NCAIR mutase (PurE)-related protein
MDLSNHQNWEAPGRHDLRLDISRRERIGMVEAIWGEHKSIEQIGAALVGLQRGQEIALVTRLEAKRAEALLAALPAMGLDPSGYQHHHDARCLASTPLPKPDPDQAPVAILGGGSSDLAVAAEAHLALACHGIAATLLLDVGVAGLHRLLDRLEGLRQAPLLIACAGMEGALPTVLAGLLPQPVIGVPVSVGYGVSAGGQAALHGMLASCAPGLTVVNIDNGYGAAMAALRILGGARRPLNNLSAKRVPAANLQAPAEN